MSAECLHDSAWLPWFSLSFVRVYALVSLSLCWLNRCVYGFGVVETLHVCLGVCRIVAWLFLCLSRRCMCVLVFVESLRGCFDVYRDVVCVFWCLLSRCVSALVFAGSLCFCVFVCVSLPLCLWVSVFVSAYLRLLFVSSRVSVFL